MHRRNLVDKLLMLGFVSAIPIILVVTPNYNHWIFIHFIVLSFIAVGINEIFINKKVQLAMILSYGILFLNFSSIYFNQHNISVYQYDVDVAKKVKKLGIDKYKKVYFDTTYIHFLVMIRDLVPVSPYRYQMTKNNPNSKKYLEVTSKFENYQMIDSNNLNTDIKGKSMVLLDVKKIQGFLLKIKS
ncbi:hypothetical protein I6E16_07800 [Ligilactobacillus salivarius]|uniref:hypothetical protein n=1 Tax=Ligilactobacillus salivarius TaxID=1624 RepID=UPI001F1B4A1B|nr:hypothetical protein [Ligilactobacillus salivarius]MCF2624015.1 hypothetical protein [Ligilactobacillus salivarius]